MKLSASLGVPIVTMVLVGCHGDRQPTVAPLMVAQTSAAAAGAADTDALAAKTRHASLAYEHTVALELPEDELAARVNEVKAACETFSELGCTVIDVSFGTEYETPSGRVRVRVPPGSVDRVIEIAAKGAILKARGSHAEDLAEPISDAQRQLVLLTTHRDRLSEFLKRTDLKVDQVISLSKEISSTQTQIDALGTTRANLQRRIDTDLLTISFSPPHGSYDGGRTPIRDALRTFGSDFRDAVGSVIRFVAILVPWLVIILPGFFLLRLFWRSITRWLARRSASG